MKEPTRFQKLPSEEGKWAQIPSSEATERVKIGWGSNMNSLLHQLQYPSPFLDSALLQSHKKHGIVMMMEVLFHLLI